MNKKDEWYYLLREMGCIVCLNEHGVRSEPDMHHLHENGNRRVSDMHTIPLCPTHHRSGMKTKLFVSRHPWKKEFEKRYGSEWELWEQVKELAEELKNRRVGH